MGLHPILRTVNSVIDADLHSCTKTNFVDAVNIPLTSNYITT